MVAHALGHHLNPFLNDYVWAPVGFNFAWMTYLTSGGDIAKLNMPALESHGLFPANWKFDPTPSGYRDIWAGNLRGKVGVGVIGSAAGLKPIIEDYRADAEDLLSVSEAVARRLS